MKKAYKVVAKKSVAKDARKLPSSVLQSIEVRIALLANDPFPPDVEPIQGYKNYYRIRIGNYRVIYEIATEIKIITIIKVGHRKDVYKKI